MDDGTNLAKEDNDGKYSCSGCGARRSISDHRISLYRKYKCRSCRAREWRDHRKSLGLCSRCDGHADGGSECTSCRKQRTEKLRETVSALRERSTGEIFTCAHCLAVLPASSFGYNGSGKIRRICYSCLKGTQKRRVHGSEQKRLSEFGKRKCSKCLSVLELSEFYDSCGKKSGKSSHCKDCVLSSGRERRNLVPVGKCINHPSRDAKHPRIRFCSECSERSRMAAKKIADKRRSLGICRRHGCNEIPSSGIYCGQHKAKSNDASLLRRVGITGEMYTFTFMRQGGRCAICKSYGKKENRRPLVADHCHKTGTFRGLLCDLCNVGIGSMRDSPSLLMKSIEYLKQTTAPLYDVNRGRGF